MEMRKALIVFGDEEVLVVTLVSVSGVCTGFCMVGGFKVGGWSTA